MISRLSTAMGNTYAHVLVNTEPIIVLRTGTPISEHNFTITLATISLEDYMIWTRKLHHKIEEPFL